MAEQTDLLPSIDQLVDVDAFIEGEDFGCASAEARTVFTLAHVVKSTAYSIGHETPLGEQLKLKAVRMIYDAQNPGFEGNAG